MLTIFDRIISLIIGYAFGCFQTAYILGKTVKGVDVRNFGSGNLGTTNAFRVLGKKLGLITFASDVLKAVVAFFIARAIYDDSQIAGIYAGLGVVMGHNWPFYLNFKGGKGVAVTSGILLCINPLASIIITGSMLILIFITKYVSLGSILGMLVMIAYSIVRYRANTEMLILIIIIGAISIFKHRENIKRLIKGKENRIEDKKIQIVDEGTEE